MYAGARPRLPVDGRWVGLPRAPARPRPHDHPEAQPRLGSFRVARGPGHLRPPLVPFSFGWSAGLSASTTSPRSGSATAPGSRSRQRGSLSSARGSAYPSLASWWNPDVDADDYTLDVAGNCWKSMNNSRDTSHMRPQRVQCCASYEKHYRRIQTGRCGMSRIC
jgi:hypothetical protein